LAGDTDAEARQAVVERYGEFVLLKPRVEPATYALWFGPVTLLVAGFAGIVAWMRHRPLAPANPAPLTSEEQQRLNQLIREADC
jgi:cytochrome c-type biogenesis protein CcmH